MHTKLYPHSQTNKKNMESAQAMVLGNCRVTIAEIAARLGIDL
jgi:hypothetical protein